jgi:hypothetical protein
VHAARTPIAPPTMMMEVRDDEVGIGEMNVEPQRGQEQPRQAADQNRP